MSKKARISSADVDSLLKALLVLTRTADHVLGERAIARGGGGVLSPSKVLILRFLQFQGPQTLSAVAHMLGVTKPAVTQIVDVMERETLLTRSKGGRDRREVALRPTPRGRRVVHAIEQVQRELVRTAIRESPLRESKRCTTLFNETASALAQAGAVLESFCAQCGAHRDGRCVLDGGESCCLFLKYARVKRGARRA